MTKPKDHIGAFSKGLRVLEAFGADRPRLSIAEAASATGLDRATARRCLLTLHHDGYADYDGKFFTLTHRALRLGMSAMAALPLPQIVQPWLDQLSEQIGQSCSVCVLDGTEITYVARAAQRRVMSIGLMPGSRLPAHCTSMGRVLLAALPEADALARIEASDLSPRTPHSLTAPQEIMENLRSIRAKGYALIDQEVELGLRALAVPLTDSRGAVVAALNTGMAATQSSHQAVVDAYLPALLKVQAGLARML
jgi:IclR family pca regulon transcriptional regulator